MADWTSLPTEILEKIALQCDFIEDFTRFYLTCKSWQLVTTTLGKNPSLPLKYPWVMLTDTAEKNYPKVTKTFPPYAMLVQEYKRNKHIEGMHRRRFYSFSASKTYDFELPEATRKKCLGVNYGWLLTIGFDLQINLLHPFSRQQIGMPNLLSFKNLYNFDDEQSYDADECVYTFVVKAVMSSSNPQNTCNEDCVILAIYGECGTLALARPGDKVWTEIDIPSRSCSDIVYYKGEFYVVNCQGVVFVCDIYHKRGPKATPIVSIRDCIRGETSDVEKGMYLVESSGFLLLVVRLFESMELDIGDGIAKSVESTSGFLIFKLEKEEESLGESPFRATRMNSLGDESLFIGYNASVSVPSSKCVKANCIYFSQDDQTSYYSLPYGGGRDTGIYDVENKSVTWHYASEFTSHLTPPLWFV